MRKQKIIGLIASGIFSLYKMSFRYRFFYEDPSEEERMKKLLFTKTQEPSLFGVYHQEEIPMLGAFIGKHFTTMVSQSKDGEIMNTALNRLGIFTVRGSSSRGGMRAFIEGLKHLKEGAKFAFAVDGPRGPIYEVKEGIIKMSEKAEVPITPARCFVRSRLISGKSWNRAIIPLPFSRIDIHVLKTDFYTKEGLEAKLRSFPRDFQK